MYILRENGNELVAERKKKGSMYKTKQKLGWKANGEAFSYPHAPHGLPGWLVQAWESPGSFPCHPLPLTVSTALRKHPEKLWLLVPTLSLAALPWSRLSSW